MSKPFVAQLRASAAALLGAAALVLAGPAAAQTTIVPLGGNAFITQSQPTASEQILDSGLANWNDPATVVSTYVYPRQSGALQVSLLASLNGSSTSTVKVTINGSIYRVTLSGKTQKSYPVGTVYLAQPGYIKVDLQGISKKGNYFGDVAAIQVAGAATAAGLYYANDAANFYWSRRGASVHLAYTVPASTAYFYNEVTVPSGQDPVGSYFMANGFDGGYFGMQVNSATERRILFSVWDGSDGSKTTLVRKGANVVDNSFGGEGTGGQAYLDFNWVAGQTYKFITRAQPMANNSTEFTSWFYAPETDQWRLIASWNRPAGAAYLSGVYSFLENFDDSAGYKGRQASYANQWARSSGGVWTELTRAYFDTDATGENKQRMDFAGGVANGRFFLRNGGFFSTTVLDQSFNRPATGVAPTVDVNQLP